jgi:phosphate transport system permease protein
MKETQGVDYSIRFSMGLVLLAVIIITNFALNFVKNRIGNIHE